jgi:hypothetical protein
MPYVALVRSCDGQVYLIGEVGIRRQTHRRSNKSGLPQVDSVRNLLIWCGGWKREIQWDDSTGKATAWALEDWVRDWPGEVIEYPWSKWVERERGGVEAFEDMFKEFVDFVLDSHFASPGDVYFGCIQGCNRPSLEDHPSLQPTGTKQSCESPGARVLFIIVIGTVVSHSVLEVF